MFSFIHTDEGELNDEDLRVIIEADLCIDILWLSKLHGMQALTISLRLGLST